MLKNDGSKENFYKSIIDSMPSAIFIMDYATKIIDYNKEAINLTGIKSEKALQRLDGDVLHCLHALNGQEDCGNLKYCCDCVIRNSINIAIKGEKVYREKAAMTIKKEGCFKMVYYLVTASPVEYQNQNLILVSLEDITEITQLGGIVPICASCKKIRDSHGIWNDIEAYIQKHSDVRFSHSICSDCATELYPDIKIYED